MIPGLSPEIGGDRLVPRWLPDVIRPLVANVATELGFAVYFDFGHYQEVARNLTMKDASVDSEGQGDVKDKKYPLVWLVMDTDEVMGGRLNEDAADLSLQIIIAMPTQPSYTMDSRWNNVFEPTLYPIYASLMYQFATSDDFGMLPIMQIQHTKTDRPYWGGQDGKGNTTGNLFNDFIDAIQIRNLKLKLTRKCE